jgi:hypothetical protein
MITPAVPALSNLGQGWVTKSDVRCPYTYSLLYRGEISRRICSTSSCLNFSPRGKGSTIRSTQRPSLSS